MPNTVNNTTEDVTNVEEVEVQEGEQEKAWPGEEDLYYFSKAFETPSQQVGQPTLPTEEDEDTEDELDPSQSLVDDDNEVEEEIEEELEPVSDEGEDESDEPEEEEEESLEEETIEQDWTIVTEHSTYPYNSKEEVVKGIIAKDNYIVDLEKQVDENKDDLANLSAQVDFYSKVITPEMLEAAAIQSYLPDEYKGKTDDDFESDEDQKKFWTALAKAEWTYKQVEKDSVENAKKSEEEKLAMQKQAAKFVREIATNEFFDVRTPEQRNEIRKKLQSKDDKGHTVLDHARFIYEVFGEESGKRYLDGLRLEIHGVEESVETPKVEDKSKKKDKPINKKTPTPSVVQKVKRKKMKVKTTVTPPADEKTSKDPGEGKSYEELMMMGFAQESKR